MIPASMDWSSICETSKPVLLRSLQLNWFLNHKLTSSNHKQNAEHKLLLMYAVIPVLSLILLNVFLEESQLLRRKLLEHQAPVF